jgi:tRNA pseudouridine55 synthase
VNIERAENAIAIHFRIVCSKGTYIRSIARDLGTALNSGAYLGALRRTRIGQMSIDASKSMEEWMQTLEKGHISA